MGNICYLMLNLGQRFGLDMSFKERWNPFRNFVWYDWCNNDKFLFLNIPLSACFLCAL